MNPVCREKQGTVTGYRRHMDKRAKIAPDGKKYGKRHRICDECRYAATVNGRKYRNKRILNGARSVQRDETSTKHYKLIGGHIFVDATGTRRRLQALAALGWSWNVIGSKLGQKGTNIGFTALKRTWVYPETAQKIKALFNELEMIPPPSDNTPAGNPVKVVKTRAARKGWLPPFAWEEDLIDDPYALPTGVTKKALWHWYLNAASEIERVEWVLEHGIPTPVDY